MLVHKAHLALTARTVTAARPVPTASAMLIELTVENHKSFLSPQTFSMEAARGVGELPGNLVKTPRLDLVKSAAIFGHNASGKTNLLDALYVLSEIVRRSATSDLSEDGVYGLDPHALTPEAEEAPTSFTLEVLLGRHRYRHRLVASTDAIHRETLQHAREDSGSFRWTTLFDRRDDGDTVLHTRFATATQQRILVETTHSQRSIVGHAAALDVNHARRLFDWYRNGVSFFKLDRQKSHRAVVLDRLTRALGKSPAFRKRFVALLAAADVGVVDVRVDAMEANDAQMELAQELGSKLAAGLEAVQKETGVRLQLEPPHHTGLRLVHRNAETGHEAALPLMLESAGTQRFLLMLYLLLWHGKEATPHTLVIDEMEGSLSDEMVQALIRLVHDPELNPNGSQLIFSTHFRGLLDETDLLRRDQIWITDKADTGATDLYNLSDFGRAARRGRPMAGHFSAGRFGGVADFDAALRRIRSGDEPLLFEAGA